MIGTRNGKIKLAEKGSYVWPGTSADSIVQFLHALGIVTFAFYGPCPSPHFMLPYRNHVRWIASPQVIGGLYSSLVLSVRTQMIQGSRVEMTGNLFLTGRRVPRD